MAFLVNMAQELRLKSGTQGFKLYKCKMPLIADGLSREYGAGAAPQIKNPRVQTV